MSTPLDPIWPKLLRLKKCLCDIISDEGDPLCFCGIVPGVQIALDYVQAEGCGGSDGMAWVRLINQYPTRNFPQPAAGQMKCGIELALLVEVGLIRSFPIDADGNIPDAATYQAYTERQIEESRLMRKAILCCYGSGVSLGTYTPIGPDGGALGGAWQCVIPTAEDDDS